MRQRIVLAQPGETNEVRQKQNKKLSQNRLSLWNALDQHRGNTEILRELLRRLVGISKAQLHRYGNDGKVTHRPHGPRGRRRYTVEQLRLDAQALHLSFNEELIGQLAEKEH